MKTTLTILRPNAEPELQHHDLDEEPGYDRLRELIDPILAPGRMEHVTVLHQDQVTDMFVDEMSAVKGLPLNEAATAIYRNNWLTQHPETKPESLPAIYGPAVLSSRKVWL